MLIVSENHCLIFKTIKFYLLMKKILLVVALFLATFALNNQAFAQKNKGKSKANDKTAKAGSEPKKQEDKKLQAPSGKETGTAELDANIEKTYGITHHRLPIGAIVRVVNPKNKKFVMTEVVANITQTPANYIIKISAPASEKIGATGTSFAVEIEYGTDLTTEEPKDKVVEVAKDITKHTIAQGESLSQIAKKYKVNVASIKMANKITDANKIKVGQVITIPSQQEANSIKHKVAKGESISVIAKKYKTTSEEIKKLNNIEDINKVKVGQVLMIPKK